MKSIIGFLVVTAFFISPDQLFAQPCNANFNWTNTCNVFQFTPASTASGNVYKWNFGDGTSSTLQAPSHTFFANQGTHTYNVTLIVSGNCIPDTVTKVVSVSIGSLPDPSIASVGLDPAFVKCGPTTQNPDFELEIDNVSTTQNINTNYNINWGDGTPNYNSSSLPNGTLHLYQQVGLFYIISTVTGTNGCQNRDTFNFFSGTNPGGNLGSLANTTNCIPATVVLPIENTGPNPPGTYYKIWVTDKPSPPYDTVVYQHPPPANFSHLFTKSSCDPEFTGNNGKFLIHFQAINPCQVNNGIVEVTMQRPPIADFEILPNDLQCVGNMFTFKNTTDPAVYFSNGVCRDSMKSKWSINPSSGYTITSGSLNNNQGFSAKFDVPGTYQITLIADVAFNSIACLKDTITKTICVLPIPQSNFTKSAVSGCDPLTVTLTNTSNTLNNCKPATYLWTVEFQGSECGDEGDFTFINGTSESTTNAQILFNAPGVYYVRLKVTNECGMSEKLDSIIIAGAPEVVITPIDNKCGSITIQPSLETFNACNGVVPQLTWTFPPGGTPAITNFVGQNPPSITYGPGNYTISVSATGCSNAQAVESFTVHSNPPIPIISVNNPCVGSTLMFTNSNSTGLSCAWTGPNGYTSTECAPVISSVQLSDAGQYCLTVTNQNGCTSQKCITAGVYDRPPVSIAQNTVDICAGQSAVLSATGANSFSWSPTTYLSPSNGVGATVTVNPPAMPGEYTYIVTGSDGQNCVNWDTVMVVVHGYPSASIVTNGNACINEPYQLQGIPSSNGVGTWTSLTPNASITSSGVLTSTQTGLVNVVYGFEDPFGCGDTATAVVCVASPPIANFTLNDSIGCIPFNVITTNTSNTTTQCATATHEWKVVFNGAECHSGSGAWSFTSGNQNSISPIFSFSQSGVYAITLKVTNECGTSSITKTVVVGEAPKVQIQDIPAVACSGVTLLPTITFESCNSPITSFLWNWPTGNSSTLQNPTIVFSSVGNYIVTVTISNECGSGTDTANIAIQGTLSASASLSSNFGCVPATLSTVNNSQGIIESINWAVTPINPPTSSGISILPSSSASAPTIGFSNVGEYLIQLTVGNSGCGEDTWQDTVLISGTPGVQINSIEDFCVGTGPVTPIAVYTNEPYINTVTWEFMGGNPSGSSLFVPGSVDYAVPGDYVIKVTVENDCGMAMDTEDFKVLEPLVASAILDTTFGCVPVTIGTTNTTIGDLPNYLWQAFNINGSPAGASVVINSPSSVNPSISFAAVGTYIIRMTASNPLCGQSVWQDTVLISGAPGVQINSIEDFCDGTGPVTPIAVYTNEPYINTVTWEFVGGNPFGSSLLVPGSVDYSIPGNYVMKVTVENECGMAMDTEEFQVLEPLEASAVLDTTFGCAPVTISTSNTTIGDLPSYLWEALNINGSPAGSTVVITTPSSASPTISFNAVGTYIIKMTASNPLCGQSVWQDTVLISGAPGVQINNIEDFCDGTGPVTPIAVYTNEPYINSVTWEFVGGNPAGSSLLIPGSVDYTIPGDYVVKVTVENECGMAMDTEDFKVLEPLEASAVLDTTFGCAPVTISTSNTTIGDLPSYLWEALNINGSPAGSSVVITTPSSASPTISFNAVGTYIIKMTASNPLCGQSVWQDTVLISGAPGVMINSIGDFCDGTGPVTPVAVYTNEPYINTVTWEFMGGNPSGSSLLVPGSVDYSIPGNYVIKVTAENECGMAMDMEEFQVLQPLEASAVLDTTFGCVPTTIVTTNTTIGDLPTYVWEALNLDGSPAGGSVVITSPTDASPSISFSLVGTYIIRMTASNPLCGQSVWQDTVLISGAPDVMINSIEDFCDGTGPVTPIAVYTNEPYINTVTWEFLGGNPSGSSLLVPGSVDYSIPGNYVIKVTVENECGMAMDTEEFQVLEPLEASAVLDTTFGCVPATIVVTNTTTGDLPSYLWEALNLDGSPAGGSVVITSPTDDSPSISFSSVGTYVIRMTASNSLCGQSVWQDTVLISGAPDVMINSIDDFCDGTGPVTPIAVYTNEPYINTVTWEFVGGNPSGSSLLVPGSVDYSIPGNYVIKVTVENECGMAMDTEEFQVLEPLEASAVLDTTFGCVPATIVATNTTTGDLPTYLWEALNLDGSPAGGSVVITSPTDDSPSISFSSVGTYIIRMTASNPLCGQSVWQDTVLISGAPDVMINSIDDFCDGTGPVTPIAVYTNEPYINTVTWEFVGGNPSGSNLLVPGSVDYAVPGDYVIKVTVENECGMAMDTEEFKVLQPLEASAVLDTTFGCVPATIVASNTTTGDLPTYLWEALNLDGSPAGGSVVITSPTDASPSILFSLVGTYIIRMTASNPLCGQSVWQDTVLISGAPDVMINSIDDFCDGTGPVTPIAVYTNEPYINTVTWEFVGGNPSGSSLLVPGSVDYAVPGDYVIKVTVENECGMAMDTEEFKVLQPLEASAVLDTTFGCVPATIVASNTTTGDLPSYLWEALNLDGSPAGGSVVITSPTDDSPSISFSSVGTYIIRMTASNPLCGQSIWQDTVLISGAPGVMINSIDDFCDGTGPVTPIAVYTNEPYINTVTWEFVGGNPSGSSLLVPGSVDYAVPGDYVIKVTVENECGMAMDTEEFKVLQPLEASAVLDTTFGCVPATIVASNTTTGDLPTYLWEALNLDGSPAGGSVVFTSPSDDSPSISFSSTGTYIIRMTASNPLCGQSIWQDTVLISGAPDVMINSIDDFCDGTGPVTPIAVYTNEPYINTVTWEFVGGNPSGSSLLVPGSVDYTVPGDYVIKVTVENECGMAMDTEEFKVLEPLEASAVLNTEFGCLPFTLNVSNTTTGDLPEFEWQVINLDGSPVAGGVSINDPSLEEPTFTFSIIGTFVVKLTASNPICGSSIWQDTVVVNKSPEFSINPIPDFCAGAQFTPMAQYELPLEYMDSVRWFFVGASSPVSATSNEFSPGEVSYTAIGTYEVCLAAYNGCGADTVCNTFKVLEPLLAIAALDADSSCSVPFVVSVENNSTGDDRNYLWSVAGPSPVAFDANIAEPQFNFTAPGIYVLKLALFNSVCDSVFWNDTVTILLPPTVTLADYDRFCEEVCLLPEPTYSTGSSPVDSVSWVFTGGSPQVSSELYPSCVNYQGPGTFVYSVTAFNVCGMSTASDEFIVDTIPEINLGPADTLCLSDGITNLFPATPPGGVWSGPGIVAPGLSGTFDPSVVPLVGPLTTVEVTYTYTNGECVVSKTKDVLVIDMSFVDGGPSVNTCISDTMVVLNGGLPSGGWYTGQGITDSIGFFNPSSLASGAYIISYSYQLPNTDCVGTDTFLVYVRPLPIPEFDVTDSLCIGVEATYFNQSQGASNYSWNFDDGTNSVAVNAIHAFYSTGFHTVQLIAISEFGCMDSIQKKIFVSGPPVSQFEMDTMEGCAVLPVNFTNTSIGYQFVNYSWDFGNGETSQQEQPVTIYYEQGLRDTFYYINLNATNHCGTDDYMDSVHVYPKPLASIKLSQDYGCTALPVAFNNLTQGLPDYFAWYIDGVLYSTDSIAPSRLFTATGEDNELYTIEFVAYNECGTDTATNIITVLPDSLRAFFSVDRNVGCEPLTITFDNSTAPDSLVVYNWYFDQNEDTSTEEDESYTFYASGDTITKYTVVLVANNGCALDSFSIDITVYPAPKVDFEAPLYACAEDTVQFISQSVDVNGYLWEFGDGDTSTMTNPVHLFNNYGQYWVKMTAYAAGTGCPASDSAIINIRELPTPKLDVTSIFGCPPLTVNLINQTENPTDYYYRWDFGDGNTAVGTNPGNHTYFGTGTYGVTLWAVDVYGCDNDTVFQAVTVYPVPNADFEIINQDTCGVPLQVCFDNNSSGAAGYSWDLGNGSLSVQNSPCTVYNNPGEVEITLLASNEFLCRDTTSKLFKVYDTPKAAFEVATTVICEESSLFFQNNSMNHEFSVWTFHNGTDTTTSPTWVYPDTGYFDVKLVVGNGSGCKDSISLEDFILVQTSPIANFFHDRIDNALPTTFQFTDDSSPDALIFEWDFGDGEQSDEENPMHRYLSSFDKVVYHWVTNEFGCTDTASTIINLDTLAALYIPNIMEPESGDHPEKRVFQPKGIGLAEFHVAVYARTGQLVWESTKLDAEGIPTEFWDGRMLGEEMPSGVYVWKVHKAKFIDGTEWDGMKDEEAVPRRSNFLYLVR